MADEAKTNENPAEEAADAKVEEKVEETKEEAKEEPKAEEKKEEAKEEPKEEKKEPTVELKGDAKKIMDLVKKLSAVELNDLVKALEEEFGVSAAAPVMMGGGGGGGGDDGGGDDSVTVELTEVGQSKIAVIKVVKEILGLGLKEAKDLVGGAPVAVKEKIPSDEAETIKAKLEEVGATVSFK